MLERRNAVAHRLLSMFAVEKETKHRFVQMSTQQVIANQAREEQSRLSFAKIAALGTIFFTSFGLLTLFKRFFDAKNEDTNNEDEKPEDVPQSVVPQSVPSAKVSPFVSNHPIPTVKAAQSSAEVKAAIRIGAEANKTDFKLLYGIAGAESSFRTAVKAGTSSAQGLFQFTESTWNYLTQKFYPGLKFTSADRNNPEKASKVAGLYVNTIVSTLTNSLGRKPSYGETYLGYFLGPTGAVNFFQALKESPQSVGAKLFPKAARANPNVFYSGGDTSKPLTLIQILANTEGKIQSYAQSAPDDGSSVASVSTEVAPDVKPAPSGSSNSVASVQSALPTKVADAGTHTSRTINYAKALPQSSSVSDASQIEKTKAKNDSGQVSQQIAQSSNDQSFLATGKTRAPGYVIRGSDGRLYNMQTG